MRRGKTPRREWLAVLLLVLFPIVLVVSVAGEASDRHDGWIVVGVCLLGIGSLRERLLELRYHERTQPEVLRRVRHGACRCLR
jgi:hypothetical protein